MRPQHHRLPYHPLGCFILFTVILIWSLFPPASWNLLRWPRELPLPTASGWVLESVDVIYGADGTHYTMTLVNLSPQEAAQYIAQLEDQGYRSITVPQQEADDEGCRWRGEKGTDRLELYHRRATLLVFWSHPASVFRLIQQETSQPTGGMSLILRQILFTEPAGPFHQSGRQRASEPRQWAEQWPYPPRRPGAGRWEA